ENENDDDDDDDDDKESSDSEEQEEVTLRDKIPCSHEVSMTHGTKAIIAIAADPSGARLASGSVDYNVSFKTIPTTCTYNREGAAVACGCINGSIQMWDHRKNFVNSSLVLRSAHAQSSEVSSFSFRAFKVPVFEAKELYSRYDTTDCMFSPDDSIVTGESLNKGKTTGVFVGCGNGIVKAYYDSKKSLRGAKLCVVKTHMKQKHIEIMSTQQIITPHALSLFHQNRPKSIRKQMEKDRLDLGILVKSRRPDLRITSGQGGRVVSSRGTLSSYVIRNLRLSKRIEDDQDPREAILKYAKIAEEELYWIAPAYKKTQPTTIFQSDDQDSGPSNKKQKT
ncbi:GAD1 protein, partial [Acromyrmex heyeri]